MRGYRWADDEAAIAAMRRAVPRSVTGCYELVKAHMLEGPFVMGDAYTICDPYLFTLSQWLEADGVDLDRFPRVVAHRRRVSERQAVQKALADEIA
jgi:glutathione S-transferase